MNRRDFTFKRKWLSDFGVALRWVGAVQQLVLKTVISFLPSIYLSKLCGIINCVILASRSQYECLPVFASPPRAPSRAFVGQSCGEGRSLLQSGGGGWISAEPSGAGTLTPCSRNYLHRSLVLQAACGPYIHFFPLALSTQTVTRCQRLGCSD